MILATDVHYDGNKATAAGILIKNFKDGSIYNQITVNVDNIEPYESGQFYKRELPCLLALLKEIQHKLDYIIIDGFVTLGKDNESGLGMYLHNALDTYVPIIGVAKNGFKDTPKEQELFRGDSLKPLFISSVGCSIDYAKSLIKSMHGEFRFPHILKKVDQLCRKGV